MTPILHFLFHGPTSALREQAAGFHGRSMRRLGPSFLAKKMVTMTAMVTWSILLRADEDGALDERGTRSRSSPPSRSPFFFFSATGDGVVLAGNQDILTISCCKGAKSSPCFP